VRFAIFLGGFSLPVPPVHNNVHSPKIRFGQRLLTQSQISIYLAVPKTCVFILREVAPFSFSYPMVGVCVVVIGLKVPGT